MNPQRRPPVAQLPELGLLPLPRVFSPVGKESLHQATRTLSSYLKKPRGVAPRYTLLRQYFPRGTDLSAYSQAQRNQVALRLNQRPRKTLDFETPGE
jgi:hypothetical protein